MAVKQQKSYPLRLDHELATWVKQRARDSDRSVNAEINRLIRQAKELEKKTVLP